MPRPKSVKKEAPAKVLPSTNEPVSLSFVNLDNRLRLIWETENEPRFGFKDQDHLVYDLAIEPVPGEAAVYTRQKYGKAEFQVFAYPHLTENRPVGWKYLGMITHLVRVVHKQGDAVLDSEFVEHTEKEIRTAWEL